MRVPRIARSGSVGFNMTPMIDVVFLLIIFFLVSSHLARQETHMELPLPVAASSGEDDLDSNRLIVNILDSGEYRLAGRRVAQKKLVQRLAERQTESVEPLAVKIRTSRRAPYRHVSGVLAACATAGIERVTFATYRDRN
ncbi:MAG: biopolymer transporter ExbD [Pirellulaceae bacterium]|nr:biopolymer transporter ExbD [Planctomycetaceae bacterium]